MAKFAYSLLFVNPYTSKSASVKVSDTLITIDSPRAGKGNVFIPFLQFLCLHHSALLHIITVSTQEREVSCVCFLAIALHDAIIAHRSPPCRTLSVRTFAVWRTRREPSSTGRWRWETSGAPPHIAFCGKRKLGSPPCNRLIIISLEFRLNCISV